MKSFLFFVLSLVVFATPTFPQKQAKKSVDSAVPQAKPPQVVIDNFTKEYPDITPGWRVDGENFIADFVDPNTLKGVRIVYDKDGRVIRRENELENASYPQSINDYFIKKYPGEKYRTWTSQDNAGVKRYFIMRQDETIYFDQEGKPVTASGKY